MIEAAKGSSAPKNAAVALLFIWWIGMGYFYYHQPSLSFRWDLAWQLLPNPFAMKPAMLWTLTKSLAALAWLIFLGASVGGIILDRLRIESDTAAARFGFSVGAGWGALSCVLAVLGILKLWYTVPIFAGLAALTLVGVFNLRKFTPPPTKHSWGPIDVVLAITLAAFAGLNLLGTLMPEFFYDALNYHLALPDLYWRRHGFFALPENAFSGVPFLIQTLYGIALPVGGERLSHLLHWSFGLLSALMAFDFCRRFAGFRTGLLAAVLFYSNPLVGVMSWKSAADLGHVFFQFLAIYALTASFAEEPPRPRWLALSGMFAGFAMGTKYQAWPLAGVLLAVLLWRSRSFKAAVPYLLALTAAAAVWPARNLWLYGNPIYPFFHERFSSIVVVNWREMLQDAGGSSVREFLLSPWLLSTSQFNVRTFGPVFLLGLPLFLLVDRRSEPGRTLLPCTLALWVSTCASSIVPRYFLPVFLPVAALYACAFEKTLSGKAKLAGYALAGYVLCANFFWVVAWFQTYNVEKVVMGVEDAENFLGKAGPSYEFPYYACSKYINNNLPLQSRLLVLADERGYYIQRDYLAATAFAEHPLNRYLRENVGSRELRDSLVRDGFTHILVNEAKLRFHGGKQWFKLGAEQNQVYKDFFQIYLRNVFQDTPSSSPAGCAVYEIK